MIVAAAPSPVLATPAEAERLVRGQFIEGLPYAAVYSLSPEGVARLIEMLEEPNEAPSRSRILLALGIRGGRGVYEAIERFASRQPEGEVSYAEYKARLMALVALGYLARTDPRSLALVRRWARWDASLELPRWHHGRYNGQKLALRLQESAITALAVSGRPEARRDLVALASDARVAASVPLARHRAAALEYFDRIEREGLDRTLRGSPP